MPWGGRRPGAGRKRKAATTARVLRHPSQVVAPMPEPPPIEEFDPPSDLTTDERAVWLLQAPHAFQHRTLTPATAFAFARYCQVVVLERNEAKSSGVGGPNHRGLLRQLNAYELQFRLIPDGKPAPEPVIVMADADEMFFGGVPRVAG